MKTNIKTKLKADQKSKKSDANAGTYAYDAGLGQVVKLSSRIPSVSSKKKSSAEDFSPPSCGRAQCCGGGGGCD
jgi:hypothetical protein